MENEKLENKKSNGRCYCESPKLRRRESLHCSTCGGKVSRSRREGINFLNLLNGNAEKTCLAGGAVGRREEEKELVAVGSS